MPAKLEDGLYVLEWPAAGVGCPAARYYFAGPAETTQEEFEGLCGKLILDVAKELAKDAAAAHREGYVIEIEKMQPKFIYLLEQHGYKSFSPKGLLFIDRTINSDLPHWQYEELHEALMKRRRTIIKNPARLDWSIKFFLEHMIKGELPWCSSRNEKNIFEG